MATKPSTYLNWVPGGGSAIAQPTTTLSAAGWAAGQAPAFQNVNWLFYTLDQWIQWLDQQLNIDESFSGSNLTSARLIGGGQWGFDAPSSTLSWSAAFSIAYPALADSANTASTSVRSIADGQCLYVTTSVPFATLANSVSGSALLTSVGYTGGIGVGNRVTGTGISGGTTVIAVGINTVTLSANATATLTKSNFLFSSSNTMTIGTATWGTFVPTPTQIIFARRVGSAVYLGINTSQMILRDGEFKNLLEEGYTSTVSATAGQNILKGQAVYLSVGSAAGDTGRTAGQAYLCDSSAIALSQYRSNCVGVATMAVSTGATLLIATSGYADTGAVPAAGLTSYVNPASPGNYTTTKPITEGQYVIPVGKAVATNRLQITPSSGLLAFANPTLIRIPLETLQVNTPAANTGVSTWKFPSLAMPWEFRNPIAGTFSFAGITCMASGVTITAGSMTCILYKSGSQVASVVLNAANQKNSASYAPLTFTFIGGMTDSIGAAYSTDASFAVTGTGGITMQIWIYATT